jgi:hypothetical protein
MSLFAVMKMHFYVTFFVQLFLAGSAFGQSHGSHSRVEDVSIAVGPYRASMSASYICNKHFFKSRKFAAGYGVRATSFKGANLYYVTAPAIITSGSRSPLILFKENILGNIDSVSVKTPQSSALNLMVNLQYQVTRRFNIGFNIDVAGFSFGARKHGDYISANEKKDTAIKPAAFNLLLISDNDLGMLNSELFLRYCFSAHWSIKGAGQFLFTEYKTATDVQVFPRPNNRFRNKSLMLSVGVTHKLVFK